MAIFSYTELSAISFTCSQIEGLKKSIEDEEKEVSIAYCSSSFYSSLKLVETVT